MPDLGSYRMYYGSGRRRLTIRDLPLVCMMLAGLFVLWSYFSPPQEEVIGKSALQSLAGSVDHVYRSQPYSVYHPGRHGGRYTYFPGYVHVVVDANGAATDFAQDEGILAKAPGLVELKKGDDVTLLVEPRRSAQSRLWELSSGTTTVLAYDDTRNYVERVYGHPVFWERLTAFVLFVVSIVLWRRFGTWSQPGDGLGSDGLDVVAQPLASPDRTKRDLIGGDSSGHHALRSAPAPAPTGGSAAVAAAGVRHAPDPAHADPVKAAALLLTPESEQWSIDMPPSSLEAPIAHTDASRDHNNMSTVANSETILPDQAIAPELAAAAHASDHAIPVLLALLLDTNPDVRGNQEAHVRELLGEPTLTLASALAPQVARLHPMQRLPLAALTFPTLHRRPRPELTALIACVDAMVQADGTVGLFESCLGCMLRRQLIKSLDPSANWRAGRSKVIDVLDEVALLLSLTAQYGEGSTAVAE
ncbi:MAG TPA: hypothetical protein VK660_10325, partial [Xanthomonadaceae bacterium]|nr:hypothetical protein [Xanthomonadaceae bacterium]